MNAPPPVEDIHIRPMEPADLQIVQDIDQASFSQPWPARSFAFEMQNNPAARMWVAEAGDENGTVQVCAMLVVWLVIDEAHIGTIAVHPNFRRRGIGRKLLLHGLQKLQAQGARSVYLEVRRSNTAAQSLYREFGFSLTTVRTGYYQDNGEDALILTLHHLETIDLS